MDVVIYTDGSSRGNPGPGGYGCILMYTAPSGKMHKLEMSQGYVSTTNNRMEMMAVIAGLEALKEPCEVHLTSDSKYVIDALSKGWAKGWKAKGWKKSDGKPALNAELWQRLLPLCEKHTLHYHWIKGHAGHPENERCDRLAVAQSKRFSL